MTQARLEAMVRAQGRDAEGGPGFVRFSYDGVPMAVVSDVAADRMRIFAPVREDSLLTERQRRIVL